MKITDFTTIVRDSNAIRRINILQPIGGQGDYVAPPTYLVSDKASHVFEKRRIDGKDVTCVLLDSVQAQANRFEEALLSGIQSNEFSIPNVVVNFQKTELSDMENLSTLSTPHRIFDAIIRDSEFNGEPFLDSTLGKAISDSTPRNASSLFRYSPTTLIFGGWHSTGKLGGSGNKFQRCLVSEIIGINVPTYNFTDKYGREQIIPGSKKPSSRLDPLEIEKIDIYGNKNAKHDWSLSKSTDYNSVSKPSDVNHGNIPPQVDDQGVTMDYAKQTTTITLAGLRHLHFPDNDNKIDPKRDLAAWMTLTSIALCAITQRDKMGYSLRSRCDLYPETKNSLEVINSDGTIKKVEITLEIAKSLLNDSVKLAKKHGLDWDTKPVELVPQEKLVDLVIKSRKIEPSDD